MTFKEMTYEEKILLSSMRNSRIIKIVHNDSQGEKSFFAFVISGYDTEVIRGCHLREMQTRLANCRFP